MVNPVSPRIVRQWLKGWSLSRSLPLPASYLSGFKVTVGDEKQKARYVFPAMHDDCIRLANSMEEPWIFLKICAAPEDIKEHIPEKWILQPQGYMMYCPGRMNSVNTHLPKGYRFETDQYPSTYVVKITTQSGELASIGRVVLVDDMAVYDRVVTDSHHRRKGLARLVMKELEQIALSKNVVNHFLVATEAGRALYQSLGWDVYCLYTSFVIPG